MNVFRLRDQLIAHYSDYVRSFIQIRDDGVAIIEGTRTKVIEIALDRIAHHWDADEIHRQYPYLSLGQIHAALGYYYENQEECDQLIESRRRKAEELDKQLQIKNEELEAAIKELEMALGTEDKAAIEEKNTALQTASQKLGEKMYADMQAKQAAEAAAAGGAPGANMGSGAGAGSGAGGGQSAGAKPADDNVVDAEVKEVKKG